MKTEVRQAGHPGEGVTMTEDERIVRDAWKRITYRETGLTSAGPCYVVIESDDHPTAGSSLFMEHGSSKESVFAAARAFTEERREQIRQVEEEIQYIHEDMIDNCDHCAASKRIVAREQAVLAELKRGMKAGDAANLLKTA
jgi:hypothetical protein